jgi:hypothetical protein
MIIPLNISAKFEGYDISILKAWPVCMYVYLYVCLDFENEDD